ncbi:MAG TPA: glucose 1-dehydrogenase [Gammaproteobacteria bacterium]|nr:glucose 1-dehydrogenase [Gammaproteobacteria bacterium]
MKLKNKIALITGGSSGIGLAIAQLFLQEGAKVVITGSNRVKLEKAKEQLKGDVFAVQSDIADLNEIHDLYQQIHKHFNANLDILVANAGIVKIAPVEKVTEELFDKVMSVNLKGTYFTVQKSLPYLNSPASIILISSIAAKSGMENFSVYCASKAAIISLSQTFAAELTSKNIRVNSISPGVIRTPIFEQVDATEQDLQEWSKLIPLKRVAEPSEVASIALYLASDDSSYVTATDFTIDGGLTGISLF